MEAVQIAARRTEHNVAFVWLLAALGSFVVIEPAPYDLLGIALFVGYFATGLRVPSGTAAPLLLLGIFLCANICAAIFSHDPVDSVRAVAVRTLLIANWLLLVSLVHRHPMATLSAIGSGYLFAAVCAGVIGIAGYFDIFGLADRTIINARVRGFFQDPNVYGPFLVPAVLIAAVRVEDKSGRAAVGLVGISLISLIGFLLSFSRGAWLNLGLSSIIYLSLRLLTERDRQHRKKLYLGASALIATGIGVLMLALAAEPVRQMVEKRTAIQQYDVRAQSGRFSTQYAALQRSAEEPLGIGPGQSGLDRNFGMSPHNVYLHVLVETGWAGAASFYAFILLTLYRGLSFRNQPPAVQRIFLACFAATLGILLQSHFIDSTHWRHLYLLLACLWGTMIAYAGTPRGARSARRS